MSIEEHDERRIRCRMLGHEVNFSYCRICGGAEGSPLPCRKIFDCWFELFDIEGFMRGHYSEAELSRITAPPRDKVVSLFDLIRQAQERSAGK